MVTIPPIKNGDDWGMVQMALFLPTLKTYIAYPYVPLPSNHPQSSPGTVAARTYRLQQGDDADAAWRHGPTGGWC